MKSKFVDKYHWIDEAEMLDLIAIAQSCPGAIAVNSATFVGMWIAGMMGAIVATAGCVFPSCILVTLLVKIYLRYRNLSLLQGILKSLRPAVIAMIGAAGVSILANTFFDENFAFTTASQFLGNISIQAVGIFIGSLILLRCLKMNAIYVMFLSGVAEVVLQLLAEI